MYFCRNRVMRLLGAPGQALHISKRYGVYED